MPTMGAQQESQMADKQATNKPSTPWSDDRVRVMRIFNRRLTLAENREDWHTVVGLVQEVATYFEQRSLPLPNGWARFERAREEAVAALRRLEAGV